MTSVSNSPVYNDLNSIASIKNEKDQDQALKKVAKEFESIFVHLMLKNMRNANAAFEKDSLFNSQESNFYRDMYDQQMSLSLSHGKGLGIAETLYRQLKGQYASDDNQDKALDRSDFKVDATSRKPSLGVFEQLLAQKKSTIDSTQNDDGVAPASSFAQLDAKVKDTNKTFESPLDFVEKLLPIAKNFAEKIQINPAMMLAQAALETGWGQHIISNKEGQSSFNLFNIKAHNGWAGEKIKVNTLEYVNGIAQKQNDFFRGYSNIEESLQDFIGFLQSNPRYENALSNTGDPRAFAAALQEAGYATDPKYADKLISIFDKIESWAVNAGDDGNG